MSAEPCPAPDWRSAETYRPLLAADPAVWAWEFGRRGAYRGVGDLDDPATGLCFAGPGPHGDRVPAVLWSWRADPSVPVLEVERARPATLGALDLRALDLAVLVARTDDGEQHVMVSDGRRRLRLAIVQGDILSGPVTCRYRLPAGPVAAASLAGLRRLLALRDTGHLPAAGARPLAKSARWVEILRAHDARRDGASQREIATLLFGQARVEEDWAGRSDYMRMRVQRLLRAAEALVTGGYRSVCGLGAGRVEPHPGEDVALIRIDHGLRGHARLAQGHVELDEGRSTVGDLLQDRTRRLGGAEGR